VVPKDVGEDLLMNKRAKDDLPEVSQEKSKEGLGDIYEREYLRLAMGVEVESEESKVKTEMAKLFRSLCLVRPLIDVSFVSWLPPEGDRTGVSQKLDSLSNFHFTPRPANVEATVQANVPAISMEEVIPLAVSQAQAQVGVPSGRSGCLASDTERPFCPSCRLLRRRTPRRRAGRACCGPMPRWSRRTASACASEWRRLHSTCALHALHGSKN
jgi:hypothetical protein